MFNYEAEHVFTFKAFVGAPEIIGPVPNDVRLNVPVTGGEVWGKLVTGKILPGGGDWVTLRTDGVMTLDVRITLETHDGALIYVNYTGVNNLGPDGFAGFLRGEMPPVMKIRAAPRLQTAHPAYAWANRTQFFSVGEAYAGDSFVTYDVYAIR